MHRLIAHHDCLDALNNTGQWIIDQLLENQVSAFCKNGPDDCPQARKCSGDHLAFCGAPESSTSPSLPGELSNYTHRPFDFALVWFAMLLFSFPISNSSGGWFEWPPKQATKKRATK
mmetsp:Transcript_14627/g.36538  ORF Transcript_14627/g.36538 Transcript_14627/m.36538 type:complete len:117 (+) Transcript_14627:382-732(+)